METTILDRLEARVAGTLHLLEVMTGLPTSATRSSPLDLNHYPRDQNGAPQSVIPYDVSIFLGNPLEGYTIHFSCTYGYGPDLWIPSVSWSVLHGKDELAHHAYDVMMGADLACNDIGTRPLLKNARLTRFDRALGGIDSEAPFMDYETFTVESLKNNSHHGYFQNMYLTVMCHIKERGLAMPPILCKDEELMKLVERGDVAGTQRALAARLMFGGYAADERCAYHMHVEAQGLRETSVKMARHWSFDIPLQDKFPDHTKVQGEGGATGRRYNILVVENDLDSYGHFTDLISERLSRDPRFGSSVLFTECNLSMCMDYCSTGQVDAVLLDWRNPSYHEALKVETEPNPLFTLVNGDVSAVLDLDGASKGTYTLRDGSLLNEDELRAWAEALDIRELWMGRMHDSCAERGVVPPRHYIFRSDFELSEAALITAQLVGLPLRHA